jgi:predicted nucleotidyltransferase component of viral defense system
MIKPTPMNWEDFNLLVELAMREEGFSHMRPVIEKELLHYDLLFALDKQGLLDRLTFQGGTSLRLCYGSQRFSEDLDFVGGSDFATSHLIDMKSCIESYIADRYGLEVSVKEPSEMSSEPKYQDIKVDKWQITVTTSPSRKDLPKQKIKIEVCNVPAYTRTPTALNTNYNFLPDGYSDVLIMTESLDEIMADKLISLVNTTRYVRHRDIWDLRWLKQRGTLINETKLLLSDLKKLFDSKTKPNEFCI